MKRIVFITLAILCLISCGTAKHSRQNIFDSKYISGKIFQTINEFEALVLTDNYDVIKIFTAHETLYDGKKISGIYVMTDTYQYINKKDELKTVPVYIKKKELKNP